MADRDHSGSGPEAETGRRVERIVEPGRANVVGTGLIGGSVGMALRSQGWVVSATDEDEVSQASAVELGAADQVGFENEADLTVLAIPVGAIPSAAAEALAKTSTAVTDVGSTKAEICQTVVGDRFVGGHPMAGSEQDGIHGARADLFRGAMWVLTPTEKTDEAVFAKVRSIVRSFGAETITLPALVHDALVAQVSHVPHLAAAAMMNLADGGSVEHRALLRLAAGGFRDMTRISAGRPSIWPDICLANRDAIVEALGHLISALTDVQGLVAGRDQAGLYQMLDQARTARLNLPIGYGAVDQVTEVVVPIPDRPGELAAITSLAAELDVNILDLEISHSGEGKRGVLNLVVDATKAERLVGGLMVHQYQPSVRSTSDFSPKPTGSNGASGG